MAFTRNVKYDGSRRYYHTNPHISNIDVQTFILSIMPLVVAAFAYPLGNRKMMALVDNDLNTIERIYGMTLVTLLFGLSSFYWHIYTRCTIFKSNGTNFFRRYILRRYSNNVIFLRNSHCEA
ncbi:multidrug resistance efflux transporter family protein [Staphylococcus nepalensis]|uniref:multidrug resistance efflux transporter family protein n=1 Tax=Staphylococcus nepalensis TaxID=214473 RepID=UPI0019C826A0|nr:hypothetical protein GCM10007203_04170 [Staphylococcus nepalensis]